MFFNIIVSQKSLTGISESILGSFWIQEYFKIIEYFVISVLICLLLAFIAYTLSFSGKKDLEKLSEYECGFEPFDSGTRLPFDIHFYIVGILFLIFDVEIAVMFPWVLGLKITGWFGFYCMFLFLLILTLGFVYEWHRGALIWPHKFVSKFKNVKKFFGFPILWANEIKHFLYPDKLELQTFFNKEIINSGETNIHFNSSIISFEHFWNLLPEIFIFTFICISLLAVSINMRRRTVDEKKTLALRITSWLIGGLLLTLIFYILNLIFNFNNTYLLFNNYIIVDFYTTIIKIILIITTIFILLNSDIYILTRQRFLIEFPILIVLSTFFMLILMSAFNLFTMFIGIVGFSICLYVLILFDCTEHSAREAGIKYYYLSVYSSAFIAFGLFLIYFVFGTLSFGDISFLITELNSGNFSFKTNFPATEISLVGLAFSAMFFGFLFKLAAFPCHFWASEIYEGSSNVVMAYFILPVKIAIFSFLIRLINYVFAELAYIWHPLLIISSIGSMLWGCFMALQERRVKRFIAYTSINQMGFLLIGLTTGTFGGNISSLLYLIIYVIMNIAFLCVFLNTIEIRNYHGLIYLSDFKYFGKENIKTGYSFILALIIFSMAGIPPLAGFFGKYYLLLSAFTCNLYSVVFIGLVTSLISTYYYLRIIKIMLFVYVPASRESSPSPIYKTFLSKKFHISQLKGARPLQEFVFVLSFFWLLFFLFFNTQIFILTETLIESAVFVFFLT